MSKRSKVISPWEYLAADIVPLIDKRRSRYHDESVMKDSLISAMKKFWPEGLRANECAEELLFIRSLAFRLSKDTSAKQQIDQAIYDLPFDFTNKLETLIETKRIIYELFAMGLVGLCIVSNPVELVETAKSDTPHGNMVLVANMFILAIIEAYEKKFNKLFDDPKMTLKRMLKPGFVNFRTNCKVLRTLLIEFKADGIELNGACSN